MTRILGIDPGLASTGWGIIEVENGKYRYIDHGVISTASSRPSGTRLKIIHDELEEVILRFKPDKGGVESLYFAKNVKSAIPVAQARGVILYLLEKCSVSAFEYTPLVIKQAITGSGRADKKQVQELVRLLLSLREVPKPDHSADALAAAICCYNIGSSEERGLK